MKTARRPVLTIDDPLGPTPTPTAAPPQLTAVKDKPKQATPRREKLDTQPQERPITRANDLWRQWGGHNRVASFRLPSDLLDELSERTEKLGVPLGLTTAAALVNLLDQDDAKVIELVDRADDARHQAQRRAKRKH